MQVRANSRKIIGYAILALILAIILNAASIYQHIARQQPGDGFDARFFTNLKGK